MRPSYLYILPLVGAGFAACTSSNDDDNVRVITPDATIQQDAGEGGDGGEGGEGGVQDDADPSQPPPADAGTGDSTSAPPPNDGGSDPSPKDAGSETPPDGAPDAAGNADAGVPLEIRARDHVVHLAETIGSRSSQTPDALGAAHDYLVATLEGFGYAVSRQTYNASGQTFANLHVERIGDTHPDEVVLIGAHYDSVRTTPGADDNASGVAATLELARAFKTRTLPRTVRFVFFVNEEPPFFQTDGMGSLVYAREMQTSHTNIVAMASLEMLGYYDDRPGSQDYPLGIAGLFPDTGNFVAFVSDTESRELLGQAHSAFAESGFPSEMLAAPGNLAEAGFSDHWAFWQTDVRAFMVTDTAFLRNPHYHQPTDTPDRLDFPRLAQVIEGLEGMVVALAQAR